MPKRVTVSWVDSASTPGWRNIEDVHRRPMRCETTGYLVERNKTGLVLALSRCLEDNTVPFCDHVVIPASCVVRVKVLRERGTTSKE